MPPDHHHSSSMAWQNYKLTNTNLRRNSSIKNEEDANTKRSSILSNASNSSFSFDHNSYSPPRRNSNSNLLDRIKYFEGKTDHIPTEPREKQIPKVVRKLSLKKVIDDIRAQFPEEDVEILNGNPIKRNSKESNSPRLSYNDKDHLMNTKELVKRDSVKEIENLEEVPEKKLSVKKTIIDAREEFININVKNTTPDSLYSKCDQFFSTSNNECLLKEMTVQTHFRIILKGSFYDNNFYPEELASRHMRYYIHDFFDYNLSPFEYD